MELNLEASEVIFGDNDTSLIRVPYSLRFTPYVVSLVWLFTLFSSTFLLLLLLGGRLLLIFGHAIVRRNASRVLR